MENPIFETDLFLKDTSLPMKLLKILFLASLIFVISCSGTKDGSQTKDDGIIEVIFLQVNDVYEIAPVEGGKSGGMARVATLRNQLLKENPNTLTVLAGDFLNPSVIATLPYDDKEKIKGRHMVDVMNHTGIDLVCFGNHEFDLKENELQQRIDESQFQWISTNVFHKTEHGTKPFHKNQDGKKEAIPETWIWEVVDADGTKIKIGFLSACVDSNPNDYVYYEYSFSKAFEAYQTLINSTDIVLGLTHLEIEEDMKLAEMIPNVALIMGGHNHYNMIHKVDNVVITKADANARTAYVHRLTYNTKTKKTKVSHELISLNESVALDPKVDAVVKKWTDLVDEKFAAQGFDPNEVLMTISVPLDGRENSVRFKQTNLGQLITKSMSMAFQNKNDCAIVNSGSIRLDDHLSGSITQLDIIRSLPFGGKIAEVKMTGKLLQDILNEGVASKGKGAYLQWDKIEHKELGGSWMINNEPLNPEKEYSVIVSEYLLLGLDIKALYRDAEGIIKISESADNDPENPENDIRTAIVQYLKSR